MFNKDTVLSIQDQIRIIDESLDIAKTRLIDEDRTEELYRIDYYYEISNKQKKLVELLDSAIETGDEKEAYRLVTIIDNLSLMISQDAKEVISIREGLVKINKEDLH